MILSSHLLHLVEEICTRVLVMQGGRSVAFGTIAEIVASRPALQRPAAGGRVPRAHHARRRATHVIGVFAYLAWRTAYNRVSRQIRQLRSPRYLAALVFGLAYLWIVAVEQRPQPAPAAVVGARWVELLGALGVVGAVLWGWIFGVERRVLSFTPAEVTFLFSGPVPRRGLVQYKLLRNQLLILFNSLLWTLILARERFGASPWLRALSIWVLLTTISFHRLGASFVRTSLLEHGRIGLRHRVVSLLVLGRGTDRDRLERAGRAARARGRLGGRPHNFPGRPRRGGGRAAPADAAGAVPGHGPTAGRPFPSGMDPGDGPRPDAAGSPLHMGDPRGHRVRGGRRRGLPAPRPPGVGARRGGGLAAAWHTAVCRRSFAWHRSAGGAAPSSGKTCSPSCGRGAHGTSPWRLSSAR